MQDLQGLVISDFENKANIILGKAEVDKDGLGSWVELQDVKDFSIQSNITNLFQNTCALSFSINLLNTKDRYSFHDTGANCFGYIKEGRKIRLYLGARLKPAQIIIDVGGSGDEYPYPGQMAYTLILGKNPANASGRLTSVDINVGDGEDMTDVIIATFYKPDSEESPNNFTARDSQNVGTLTANGKRTVEVDIEIEEGDYIGIYSPEVDSYILFTEGGAEEGIWLFEGDGTSCEDQEIEFLEELSIGIYATGINIEEAESADYYWSWLYGIIDKPTTQYDEAGETCNITGRDYIAYLSETYLKKVWWGKNIKYNVVADLEHYTMEEDCKGIYRAFLDRTGLGTGFEEIWLNSEWTYDWDINEFVFLKPNVPKDNGTGCLWLYYFTPQTVENVVADLLVEAEILTLSEKFLWLNNPLLCTPTGKQIERVWFDSGTAYIRAINMLTEVVIYRFYINGNHEPCFKPIPEISETVKRINDHEYIIKKTEERLDELYNQIIIKGETREMKRNWLSVMAYSSVSGLDSTSGKLKGATTDDGENLIVKRGFIWKTGEEAEISWYESGGDLGIGYYEHEITELTPGTDYKFQAYAEDNKGNKAYSVWYYFRTEEELS